MGITKISEVKPKLETWMSEMISDRLWEKFNDLHIDEINRSLKPEQWADEGLSIYKVLLQMMDTRNYDTIFTIPLKYANEKTNLEQLSWDDIKNNVGTSPPSIYFFPIGSKNYEETIASAYIVESITKRINMKSYYKEELDGDEYYRVIYIKGPLLYS